MFVCIKEDEIDYVGGVVLEVKKNETIRIETKRMHRGRLSICEG